MFDSVPSNFMIPDHFFNEYYAFSGIDGLESKVFVFSKFFY